MFVRLVRFSFGPGKQVAAQNLANDLVPAIQARPGCQAVTFFGDDSDGEYGLYVLWASQEDADAAAAVISPPVAAGPGRECSGPTGHPPFSSDRACYLGQGDQATPEAYGPTGLLELHLNCKAPVLFAA